MRRILDMTEKEAKLYFMKSSSYFNLDLPKYIDFTNLLNNIDSQLTNPINKKEYIDAGKRDNVNYKFYHNKDGKYAWRMFQLIHPVIYISLVNEITKKKNWKTIVDRFGEFKCNDRILCCSDLVESDSKEKDKGATINCWWNEIEQKSIKLSMEYDYIGITDVVDCYGSIYTHSIAWAIHGLDFAKEHRNDKNIIGNFIDSRIQNMSYGQTNGIPQGSTLMDFIAECVLGYGDLLISESLKQKCINDYQIIRYRDDYRIFSNKKDEINEILKTISEQLAKLNMRLNTQKTLLSDDVISNSIKREKIESLDFEYNDNISLQKNILKVRSFGLKYPNTGRVNTLLHNLYENQIETIKEKPYDNEVLISLIVDIMYNNTKSYPICVAILSKLLSFEYQQDLEKIILKIEKKFEKIPNTDYLSIWLQRITIKYNKERKYNSDICKMIYSESFKIWNSEWCTINVNERMMIIHTEIENMNNVVSSEDLKIFDEYR